MAAAAGESVASPLDRSTGAGSVARGWRKNHMRGEGKWPGYDDDDDADNGAA